MIKYLPGCLLIVASLQLAGCGNETRSADDTRRDAVETASGQRDQPASPPMQSTAPVTQGLVTFESGGEARRFDYLPAGHNTYTPMGSTLHAAPEENGTEQFRITLLAIDLKSLELPTVLPLPKRTGQPMSPMAAMASVGFSYIDPDGNEWAGPVTITVTSFEEGLIRGTFSEAKLPHTEKVLPDAFLTNGSFEAKLK